MDELAAALAFDRAIRVRGAQQAAALPARAVVLHHGLPRIHHLNTLILDAPLAPELDAGAIRRLAEGWLGHLRHRHVVLDDAAAAQRLAPALLQAGWRQQRTLIMVWRGEPEAGAVRDPRGREISAQELRSIQLALFADEGWTDGPADAELVRALVQAQDTLRAGTLARCFGAGEGAELYSNCTLFLERPERGHGIALIDEVGTRVAHRQRGYARAAVSCALDAAVGLGCHPIVVPADADDWPQLLYAKLGFEPVGMQVSFTLSPAEPSTDGRDRSNTPGR